MNVVRVESTLAASGRRGGGRGRGRDGTLVPNNNQIINVLPKYDFNKIRQPLVNVLPSSTSSIITPRNPRRYPTTSSSSFRKSALRGRGQGSGGQISPHSVSSDPEHCVVLAITSGRGDARGEVGIAAIDVQYPHLILCQISDCNTYINTLTKIHALNPVEIIMPDTMCERSIYRNGLHQAIKEKFDSITITSIARMHFHDMSGLDRIRTHCAEEFSSVELFVKQKYYALAAASAVLKYVEYIQHIVYAPKSMRIDFQGSQNTAMIDIESAQSLELVTSQGGGENFSLLGSLDRCSTPMGHRLIRASILQPPCDLELIKSRQACVTEFVQNRLFHSNVKPVVKRLCGASRLLSLAMMTSQADSVQAAEKNLNYILLLKNIIDIIPELRSIITNGKASFFQKVSEDLKDPRYELIKEKILSVVHPEARSLMGYTSSNMQRCFAIRSGINDMLDIARQTYCELIDDMKKLVEELSESYNLRLSLGCNANLGYHIEMMMPRSQIVEINKLPEEFIEVHRQKNRLYMTTEYLLVHSQHCRDACAELHIMSNVLLNETLNGVREYIGCLLKLSDDIGELDILMSMAQVSSISDYVMPIFGNRLDLCESRHPIMDISGSDSPISNDVAASSMYNFHTITGPNMSGKSVYLKQIVLLQIMSQIGCYVPAKSAQFRIADRIFCRMSCREDIESNASTFVLEIKESQYILQSITPTSLVVLDELCRGTTVEEGTSLAWAICEKLLKTTAFTFNATHFFYLTRLTEFYHNAKNHYVETKINLSFSNDSRLIYTHRLKSGVVSIWNYGIALAGSTGLPDVIVANAKKYADEIAKSVKPSVINDDDLTNTWKKIFYDCLAEMSKLLENDEFTVKNIVELVNKFKIPSILRNMKETGIMEVNKIAGHETTSSGQFGRNNFQQSMTEDGAVEETTSSSGQFCRNDSQQSKIDDGKLSKRESTKLLSTDFNVKKPRIRLSENSKIANEARLSQFNYLKQTARTMSSLRSYRMPEEKLNIGQDILSLMEQRKFSMDFEEGGETCEKGTNFASQVFTQRTKVNEAASYAGLSQNFLDQLPGTSQQRYSETLSGTNVSQVSSVPSYIARINARAKEAEIFRNIEGSDFDEATFFRSFESPEKMSCDEDFD